MKVNRLLHKPCWALVAALLLCLGGGGSTLITQAVETPEQKPQNPHFAANGCPACHQEGRKTRMTAAKQEKLCLSCHKDERIRTEPHPTNIASRSGRVKRVPKDFPLVWGNLGCATCHDSKIQCLMGEAGRSFNPSFLRGGPYPQPYTICYRCHNKKYYELFDPHKQLDANGRVIRETCEYCHHKPAKAPGKRLSVGEYVEGICKSCHRLSTHPTGSDHMQRPNARMRDYIRRIEEQRNLYLPLNKRNEVYCGTCHNPHQDKLFPAGDVRGLGAEGSAPVRNRLRVVSGNICTVCHEKARYGGNRRIDGALSRTR